MSTPDVPDDWYRRAYPPEMVKLPWAQKTGSEVDRVLRILQPAGDERILDLGCGTGRHAQVRPSGRERATLAARNLTWSVASVRHPPVSTKAAAGNRSRSHLGSNLVWHPIEIRD
jgi:SAM-dependent methyltransferase